MFNTCLCSHCLCIPVTLKPSKVSCDNFIICFCAGVKHSRASILWGSMCPNIPENHVSATKNNSVLHFSPQLTVPSREREREREREKREEREEREREIMMARLREFTFSLASSGLLYGLKSGFRYCTLAEMQRTLRQSRICRTFEQTSQSPLFLQGHNNQEH